MPVSRLADLALVVLLALVALASLLAGSIAISPAELVQALTGGAEPHIETVVVSLRLPRVLLGLIVGASLALAGAALQSLLANPLADPFLLGISGGGAAAATVAVVCLPAAALGLVPAAAMAGALLATAAVWWMAHGPLGASSTRLILAGVAVNAAASAVILLVLALATGNRLPGALVVTMGSLAGASGAQVWWLLPFALVPAAVLFHHGRDLGLLGTGEESAAGLGVEVAAVRRRVFLAAAALCGGAVAFAGVIGFVGLVTPHLCRLLWGPSPRRLLLRSAALGGLLLVAGDTLARQLLSGVELPVGVITAVLGVPFFVILLRRSA